MRSYEVVDLRNDVIKSFSLWRISKTFFQGICSLHKMMMQFWMMMGVCSSQNSNGREALSNVISEICKKAWISGYFTNHSLRASAAIRLYEAEVDKPFICAPPSIVFISINMTNFFIFTQYYIYFSKIELIIFFQSNEMLT